MGKQRIPQWLAFVVAGVLAASLAGCGGTGDTGPSGPPARPATRELPARPARPARPGTLGRAGGQRRQQRADQPRRDRDQRAGVGRSAADRHGHRRHDREPAGRQRSASSTASARPVVGLGNTTKSSTATVASYPNLSFALAKLVPGHHRRAEQVGELHRHDGAEHDDRGGADAPEHRQHRHAGRQRRRHLQVHLLPRHHDDQVAGRGDDGHARRTTPPTSAT